MQIRVWSVALEAGTSTYRNTAKVQADRYNKAGTLTPDPNLASTQIGLGVYTTAKHDGWPFTPSDWFV